MFDRLIEWVFIGIAVYAVVGACQCIAEIARVIHA